MITRRSINTRVFITVITLAASLCLLFAFKQWDRTVQLKFVCYLIAALLASSFKVTLPRVDGTLSVNFLFTLVGVLELSLLETIVIGLASTLAQFYWKPTRQPKPIQLIFNLSQVTLASAAAYMVYRGVLVVPHTSLPVALLLAAVLYFACNSAAMSTVIGLTGGEPISKVWLGNYWWSLPYYVVGAAVAAVIFVLNRSIGWQSSLLVLPPIYLIYRSYRLYLGKLETDARMAEQASNLHLRTIEALALAIEAKDENTGEHLQRVRVYAREMANVLNLREDEKQALKAAAVLHDIGKLAVPEQIISKPGKLSPEEFEKMKIHPVVGAEILEQVHFPYPVVPIVRSHHEKWDGTGYPDGLAGEAIPMGARILAVIDCLDALASDRQYRKALPLDEAMAMVAAQAGTSFDPQVVAVLNQRYVEMEKLAKEMPLQVPAKLSTELKIQRGARPATGFEMSEHPGKIASAEFQVRVSVARKLAGEIIKLGHRFDRSLNVEDISALISLRIRQIIPFDAFAVFVLTDGVLFPVFVIGDNARILGSLRVPLGHGLSGWVAQTGKMIVNGNPTVEPGSGFPASTLRSALMLPFEGGAGTRAVLGLYRCEPDAFIADDVRSMEALRSALESVFRDVNVRKAFAASF